MHCLTGNLRDATTAAAAVADVDAVVHLGAMMLWGSDDQNPVLFEDNLRSTSTSPTRRPSGRHQRFIFASSDEVYPSLDAAYLPIDENHPTRPYSFYGVTKLAGEQMLRYFHRANGLPISIARFALVIEPWETTRREGWLGRFLFLKPMFGFVNARSGKEAAADLERQLQNDETLILAREADGTPYQFHCVDVRDVVQGLLLMLEQPAAIGEAFNLSGPSSFAYDQAIPYLAAKTGLPVVDARIPARRSGSRTAPQKPVPCLDTRRSTTSSARSMMDSLVGARQAVPFSQGGKRDNQPGTACRAPTVVSRRHYYVNDADLVD